MSNDLAGLQRSGGRVHGRVHVNSAAEEHRRARRPEAPQSVHRPEDLQTLTGRLFPFLTSFKHE